MSAMSASPVKPPVLPPTGVQPPPVSNPPQKVALGTPLSIPSSLTISPAKPANMNHSAMPLSLIADHKIAPQYPSQSQPPVPPPVGAMQPLPQPTLRTPEKPKEVSNPTPLISKPTSNGMESLISPNQAPITSPAIPEPQTSASAVPAQKIEVPTQSAVPDTKPCPEKLPDKASEPPIAAAAPSIEADVEKKEAIPAKPVESASFPTAASSPSIQEPAKPTVAAATTTQALPATSVSTPNSVPAPSINPVTAPPSAPTAKVSEKPVPTPPVEQATPPPVVAGGASAAPSISRTDSSVPQSKPELKVATIPRQAAKRKREPKVTPVTPEAKKEGKDDDRKSKRVRLPTQPYQSPIPELNIIAKIDKKIKSTPSKAADDKLIVFYKNEFLAVRNADGGFYVCQAMQNVYKSSPRIRIRWLSQEEGKDTYSPDFYDHTDFDCILTNLNLDKVDKDKFKLPEVEQQRTESILKRALDVEKGVSEKPPVTEEHPDGLDLSLFRDESQLKKSKGRGKKSEGEKLEDGKESDSSDDENEEEKKPKKTAIKTSKRKKKTVKKKQPAAEKKAVAKTIGTKTSVQTKKKTESRDASKRKSSVSTNSQPPEKRVRKSEPSSQSSDKANKTRSVEGVAAAAKSRRDRRAKTRK